MTTAEKMVEYRKKNGYSVADMSTRSGASETLLKMVERGLVTHPKIAEQIRAAYELSDDDILEIIPENYRPGENYDPDKYKPPELKLNERRDVLTPDKDKLINTYPCGKEKEEMVR